jgi:hypothetical protein
MKAFAQKQNQPQRQVLSTLARSNATTPEPNHCIHHTLLLQRTIGNLAVQRLLRTPTEGHEVGLTSPAASRFSRDFSRISAHAPAVRTTETKLTVNDVVYRKIDFTQPKPILADPIPLAVGGSILGTTLPGFNGTLLPKTGIKKDYKEAIFNLLQPQTFNFSAAQNGKTGKVDPNKFNINVFAEVRAITEPQKDKWSGSYSPNILSNPPSVCAKNSKTNIPIDMEGKPDSTALYKKVLAHEQEHVTDLKNLSTKELKPYHDFLVGLTGTGKTDKECVDDIFKQVGNKDALAANEFVDKWLDAMQVYDKIGGTHHSKFVTKVDAECAKIQITEKL